MITLLSEQEIQNKTQDLQNQIASELDPRILPVFTLEVVQHLFKLWCSFPKLLVRKHEILFFEQPEENHHRFYIVYNIRSNLFTCSYFNHHNSYNEINEGVYIPNDLEAQVKLIQFIRLIRKEYFDD